ncbi:MAG TPA: hypothetical protein VNA04_07535 [Thermoanaerobaculia bacterium]|nr:hypothetical protein [Thermoanaerobaculia bacterium]
MRIQETDQILKETRYARNRAHHARDSFLTRVWRMILGLFGISK